MEKQVIPVCFWCGKDKNGVAIIETAESIKSDRLLIDYNPCTTCSEMMHRGVTFISVTDEDNGTPPIRKRDTISYYPTGEWAVVKRSAAENLFPEVNIKDVMFVPDITFEQLGLYDDENKLAH